MAYLELCLWKVNILIYLLLPLYMYNLCQQFLQRSSWTIWMDVSSSSSNWLPSRTGIFTCSWSNTDSSDGWALGRWKIVTILRGSVFNTKTCYWAVRIQALTSKVIPVTVFLAKPSVSLSTLVHDKQVQQNLMP